jgi:hypothetical protein
MEAKFLTAKVCIVPHTCSMTTENSGAKEQQNNDAPKVGGFNPLDLAKAPVEPPHPDTSDTRRDTSNNKIKLVVFLAAVAGFLGIIITLFFSVWLGIIILVVTAAVVVYAVFGNVR